MTSSAKKVGRPPSDPVHRIKGITWFVAVSQASGMTAAELEVLFGKSKRNLQYSAGCRPGLWNKYRDGLACPKSKRDKNGNPSIVERVENRFPGTAKWIFMPFWDVMSSAPMEMADIKNIYQSLPLELRILLVMEPANSQKTFWRRPIDENKLFQHLLKIHDLNAGIAILAIIKEAEITQNQRLHRKGIECWNEYSIFLNQHPIVGYVSKLIAEMLKKRFGNIEYAGENGFYSR